MSLSIWHILGILLTLALMSAVGIYSGKKVSNAADFNSGGGETGAGIVAGTLLGTIVGGAATVGTAQLAFIYGMSAWWFTLGAGIGFLIMAFTFLKPMRAKDEATISAMVGKEFGKTTGLLASCLCLLGMFLSIISNHIAGAALVTSLVSVSNLVAGLVIVALMVFYVVFGGVWGTGLGGVVKTILLCVSAIAAGGYVLLHTGDTGLFGVGALPTEPYANLFGRGFGIDVGACLSVIFGVLTTQTYVQAVLTGRNLKVARGGALIAAFITPLIGLGGVLIGLFMRLHHPEIEASEAFPLFILDYLPGVLGGVALAALLIAVLGTGAGLALGISTVINNDILSKIPSVKKKMQNENTSLLVSRGIIVSVFLLALLISLGDLGNVILDYAFMSMGLRAGVLFLPLCCALWLPGKVKNTWVSLGIVLGPIGIFIGHFADLPFDSLFIGMILAAICCFIGYKVQKK